MEWWQALLVLVAGDWAGTINTVVGSGSLVTFPVLVGVGLSPVNAVVSNALGLVAGGFSGAWGYRRELVTMKPALWRLLPASLVGGIIGSWLLLHLPESVFGIVSPILIALAVLLVAFQTRISAWLKSRGGGVTEGGVPTVSAVLAVIVFLVGIYGGYFTAAQGVILMAVFGLLLGGPVQAQNALKVVLSLAVNLIAAIAYLVFAPERIDWWAAGLIAVGSLFGGWLGAKIGRRLSPVVLRACIVVLGTIAFIKLVWQLVQP